MRGLSRDPELSHRLSALRTRLRAWGLSVAEIAQDLGVSRQYVWQVLHKRLPVSSRRVDEIERQVEERIQLERAQNSAGQRLRRARVAAGLTLKQAASAIGYSWVAVERWERDVCLPKPGVLWHLRHVYGAGEDWIPRLAPETLATDRPRPGITVFPPLAPSNITVAAVRPGSERLPGPFVHTPQGRADL